MLHYMHVRNNMAAVTKGAFCSNFQTFVFVWLKTMGMIPVLYQSLEHKSVHGLMKAGDLSLG